jgi:chitin disaccharide deacetylase
MPFHQQNHPENVKHVKAIALCVDDFGLHEGVNQASLNLANKGHISAIGCMVGGPTWQHSHSALADVDRERVDIGLHLDFTEHPLHIESRHSLGAVILKSYTGGLNSALVRREIAAQLDAFEKASGTMPDFVDGHQHVHQLPVIRTQLLAELESRYHAAKPWLRNTSRSNLNSLSLSEGFGHWFKPQVIQALGAAALMRAAKPMGYSWNSNFGGIYNFSTESARYPRLMSTWLKAAHQGDLIMCHPSAACVSATTSDPIYVARQVEFAFLGSHQFEELISQHRCEIKPLTQLLALRTPTQ